MTQFQLVVRYTDGDWSRIRRCNVDGEPHIDGELIVDGRTDVIKGVQRLISSDDSGDSMKRFLCTAVVRSDRWCIRHALKGIYARSANVPLTTLRESSKGVCAGDSRMGRVSFAQ